MAKAREWAKELVLELGEHGIRVDAVILFGSYARGDFSSSSDLDLIIISSDWEGISYTKRLSLLYRLWDKDIDANFVALTPRELRDRLRKSVVLRDASRYWIVLYKDRGIKPSNTCVEDDTYISKISYIFLKRLRGELQHVSLQIHRRGA